MSQRIIWNFVKSNKGAMLKVRIEWAANPIADGVIMILRDESLQQLLQDVSISDTSKA